MESNMEFIRKLPSPEELKQEVPLDDTIRRIKEARDRSLAALLTGEDPRFLLLIGPCSADREDAVLVYTERLAALQEKVADRLLLVPRVNASKPRTTGRGYMGMLHQPDPEKEEDVLAGLVAVRKMHARIVRETGLTCAEEMLYPENHCYLSDLLSYVSIGARSVEDQQHRFVASGVGIPTGMKNPTGGDLQVMMHSIAAAQTPARFVYRGWEVRTPGNPLAHAILRGAVDGAGRSIPNYHTDALHHVHALYAESGLQNPAVIVDCNHANSDKQYLEQIPIARDVCRSRKDSADLAGLVKGLMIESYLEDGRQEIGDGVFGRSITDPCLGWEKSEQLILELADLV